MSRLFLTAAFAAFLAEFWLLVFFLVSFVDLLANFFRFSDYACEATLSPGPTFMYESTHPSGFLFCLCFALAAVATVPFLHLAAYGLSVPSNIFHRARTQFLTCFVLLFLLCGIYSLFFLKEMGAKGSRVLELALFDETQFNLKLQLYDAPWFRPLLFILPVIGALLSARVRQFRPGLPILVLLLGGMNLAIGPYVKRMALLHWLCKASSEEFVSVLAPTGVAIILALPAAAISFEAYLARTSRESAA